MDRYGGEQFLYRGGVPPPKAKSRSREFSAAAPYPSPGNAKTYPDNSTSVITKCCRAPSSQPRKQQQALCEEEMFDAIVYHYREDMSPRQVPMKNVLKPSVPKRILEVDSDKKEDEDEDDDDDDDGDGSDFQLEDFSPSDEECEIVIKNARKRLRQLLAETTFLVDELEKMENDVQRLQDEKEDLLEQLFTCEGFAVDPYPPFRPLSRKIKLLRTKL